MKKAQPQPQQTIYKNRSFIKDLFIFLAPYRGRFVLASVLRVISDLAWLYFTYGLASLVDFFTAYKTGDSLMPVWTIVFLLLGAILGRHLFRYAAKIIAFSISTRMVLDAQTKTIANMFRLDMVWHERENVGNKMKRIARGAESLDRLVRMWINNVLEISVNFVGILFVIATFDRIIALLMLVFLLAYYAIATLFNRQAAKASQIVNVKEEDVSGLLFESINNMRTVKIMAMARALLDVIKKESENLYQKIVKRIFWFQIGATAQNLWAQLFRLGVLILIIRGILEGHYQVGFPTFNLQVQPVDKNF